MEIKNCSLDDNRKVLPLYEAYNTSTPNLSSELLRR